MSEDGCLRYVDSKFDASSEVAPLTLLPLKKNTRHSYLPVSNARMLAMVIVARSLAPAHVILGSVDESGI